MTKAQFLQLLQQDGFPEPVEVKQAPNGQLDNHGHPFEVKALVVEGDIKIIIDGITKTYRVGDIFQLSFNEIHAESYGSDGVKYLASRKHSNELG